MVQIKLIRKIIIYVCNSSFVFAKKEISVVKKSITEIRIEEISEKRNIWKYLKIIILFKCSYIKINLFMTLQILFLNI